jgi:hypothetical protein
MYKKRFSSVFSSFYRERDLIQLIQQAPVLRRPVLAQLEQLRRLGLLPLVGKP